jgi:hypothetical protein
MHRKLFGLFIAALAIAPSTSGCADPQSETDDLSASSRSYVTLTHDARKCMSPVCGGYWVKDVNRKTAAQYVSGLDFSASGLDQAVVDVVLAAPPEELVLRGKLGPVESAHNTRAFLVSEAYLGMPGMTPAAGEVFYQAKDRSPTISCFAAPCPNEAATKLNATAKTYFSGYSVARAAAVLVDQDWLIERINHDGAIVAAKIVDGQAFPAGKEQVLDASQVYLRADAVKGPCPAFKLAACPKGQVWTYTRDQDLCLHPDKCVLDAGCPSLQPPKCASGYDVASYRIDAPSCVHLSCDPGFVNDL